MLDKIKSLQPLIITVLVGVFLCVLALIFRPIINSIFFQPDSSIVKTPIWDDPEYIKLQNEKDNYQYLWKDSEKRVDSLQAANEKLKSRGSKIIYNNTKFKENYDNLNYKQSDSIYKSIFDK
jgi:hypothetical protein